MVQSTRHRGAAQNLNPDAGDGPLGPADDAAFAPASLSSALTAVFRGNFCDTVLPGRNPVTFERGEALFEVGETDRTLFVIRRGFVKVETVTHDSREIIYDIRTAGDVVGELCTFQPSRGDRAVAIEQSEAIPVHYSEIVEALQKNAGLLNDFVKIFSESLLDAYEQIDALTYHDIVSRLIAILLGLASKIGRAAGAAVEIPTYLTQEQVSQMVAARRERVSTAMNFLRRRGMVRYSNRGHLLLNVDALKSYLHSPEVV